MNKDQIVKKWLSVAQNRNSLPELKVNAVELRFLLKNCVKLQYFKNDNPDEGTELIIYLNGEYKKITHE